MRKSYTCMDCKYTYCSRHISNDLGGILMTIEELLAELAEFGYLVNNCFQHEDGTWQANFRRPDHNKDGDWFTSFGIGPTALAALTESFEQIVKSEFYPNKSINIAQQGTVIEAAPKEAINLLQLIGLDKPKPLPPIVRRL